MMQQQPDSVTIYRHGASGPARAGIGSPGTAGDDLLAGDAFATTPDPLAITLSAGSGEDTVDGGSDETAQGGLDTLEGLAGADVIIGDVLGKASGPIIAQVSAGAGGVTRYDFTTYTPAPVAGNGGSGNNARGFGDRIDGGIGDDTLVGDVVLRGRATATLDLNAGGGGISGNADGNARRAVKAAGGDANVADGFADTLVGGNGSDVIIGDLRKIGGSAVIAASAGSGDPRGLRSDGYGGLFEQAGRAGDRNHAVAFNDHLAGDAGQDVLVGDAMSEGSGTLGLSFRAGATARAPAGFANPIAGGAMNTVRAADDVMFGGGGDDLLVGDAYRLQTLGESATLLADAGGGIATRFFRYAIDGGSGNRVDACSDLLMGQAGDDTLVGDACGQADLTPLSLLAQAGVAGDGYNGGLGGADNIVSAFGDSLSGGAGRDVIAGDVFRSSSSGDVALRAAAGSGASGEYGRFGGMLPGADGGSDNSVRAFNDSALGDAGSDLIAGDLAQQLSRGETLLVAEAGRGAAANSADGGSGGSDNRVWSFADTLLGGDGADTLVGDVSRIDAVGGITLKVQAGTGGNAGSPYGLGGAGGSDDRIAAFSDQLAGGAGHDWLVGDVWQQASSGILSVAIASGMTGDGGPLAGAGGDDNRVIAFDDILRGGAGDDTLVGDVAQDELSPGAYGARFTFDAGSAGSGGAQGGTGNIIRAFCDTLVGGEGDDLLSGDFLSVQGFDALFDGGGGNRMTAFADSLLGGAGNDTLFGEEQGDTYVYAMIQGSFGGRKSLFADTLSGGAGDDVIAGGIGADLLSGGPGHDRFTWTDADLRLGSYGGQRFDVVDTISDFTLDDLLDLRAFNQAFDQLQVDDITLRGESGGTVVSIRPADVFQDLVVLRDFTTALSAEDLIDSGVILIA